MTAVRTNAALLGVTDERKMWHMSPVVPFVVSKLLKYSMHEAEEPQRNVCLESMLLTAEWLIVVVL